MNHPYQVMGTTVPKMLGRRRLIEQIERHVLKPSPDHVQIVGPTLFGKSVLLAALAARHEPGNAHYLTATYADLRHAPPADDSAFRRRFAEVVKAALARVLPEVADYIDLKDSGLHELLDLSFQELEQKKARLLVVLDGFDHVLAGSGITRTLWDQLRSLAQKSSLRLVTGSRQPLRELCKTEESRTSDLWEIFYDTPIVVGPFVQDDWDDVLAPLTTAGVSVDSSARKELMNWSGGVPVLTAALLERLASTVHDGQTLSKSDVDRVAAEMLERPPAHLQQLWEDCNVELRGDLAAIGESDGIPLSDLPAPRQRAIDGRGYGAPSGNRMRSACRLMARYAPEQGPAVADLKRLFGTATDYLANVEGFLELRVGHLASQAADPQLLTYLRHSIRDVAGSPEMSLVAIRSLVQRALQLIWAKELGASRTLPDDWITEWQHGGAKARWLDGSKRVPSGDGEQMYALDLLTGKKLGFNFIDRKGKALTKSTFLLLDSLQSIGDFGQHLKDYPECPPTTSFAVAVIGNAIEFVSGLTKDLA
ncbi:MAG: ATP-binding protein [Deltaproteobacteria bacterium]|nr:ATP-binding protein [Deltaproteobacteria bacterium]